MVGQYPKLRLTALKLLYSQPRVQASQSFLHCICSGYWTHSHIADSHIPEAEHLSLLTAADISITIQQARCQFSVIDECVNFFLTLHNFCRAHQCFLDCMANSRYSVMHSWYCVWHKTTQMLSKGTYYHFHQPAMALTPIRKPVNRFHSP